MNFETDKDIRNGIILGSGTYGSVYRHDNYAIKIYHEYEKGTSYKNSCLRKENKVKLLLKKATKINNTDLIVDLVYINGFFKGVCYPYQDADPLYKIIDFTTFEQKVNLSKQLIENIKELNKNFIYPLDLKLNNILYDGEKIEIIDLDDTLTIISHFYHPLLLKRSLYSLKKTLIDIFEINQFNYTVLSLLDSYREFETFRNSLIISYKSLNNFLDKKNIQKKLLFINYNDIYNINIEKLKKIIDFTDCKIVLIISNDKTYLEKYEIETLINTIKNLELVGIKIYDLLYKLKNELIEEKIRQYINSYNTSSFVIIDSQNIFESLINNQDLENDLNFCIDKLNCKIKKR